MKELRWLFLIILLQPEIMLAQQAKIDSLEMLLQERTNADANRVDVLNALAFSLLRNKPEESLRLLNEARDISQRIPYKEGLAESNRLEGIYYWQKADYQKARESLDIALMLFEETNTIQGVANTLNNIGNNYFSQGDYNFALEYYQKALHLYEESGDGEGQSNAYNNLGVIFRNQGDHSRAFYYYKKALKIQEESKDSVGISRAYNNIGNLYYYRKDFEKALENYSKSMEIRKILGDRMGLSFSFHNMGNVYREKKQYDKALEYYFKSLEIGEALGDKGRMASTLNFIGVVHSKLGNEKEAKEYFDKSMVISNKTGSKTTQTRNYLGLALLFMNQKDFGKALDFGQKAYRLARESGDMELVKQSTQILSEAYALAGNYKSAYQYSMEFKNVSDSILNEENVRKIVSLEYEYAFEKEQEITRIEQDKAMELHQAELRRENAVRNYLLVALALVSSLLFITYRLYNLKRKSNVLLAEHQEEIHAINEELEVQNQEILSAKLLAEESETRFRILVDNIPGVIFRCINDSDWTMVYVSNAIENLVGYPASDFLHTGGRTYNSVIHPDFVDLVDKEIQRSIHENTPYNISYQVVCSDGSIKWVNENGQGVFGREGQLQYIDGVIIDATALVNIQEKLRQNEARLIELNKTKDKFFSIIGHDLKNPFSALINVSSLLMENRRNFSEAEMDEVLKMVHSISQNTYSLLVNLLEWAKSQSGNIQMRHEVFDLKNLAIECIELHHELAENKKIRFENQLPAEMKVFADRNMIKTVVRNLISNAIKFTREGGEVRLTARENEGFAEVAVADTGVGMDEKTIDSLFKIDSTSSHKGTAGEPGTGLGLILCKEFIEKNNGRIWVESELGKGSVFCFSVPLQDIMH